jgi:hypothetical protein
VDYRTDNSARHIAPLLWKRSLSEIASQTLQGSFRHVGEFLQIFSFFKDSLSQLASVDAGVEKVFICIMNGFFDSQLRLSEAQWHAAIAQAAQEALFPATPLLKDVDHIHFHGHQQLPYAYVQLDLLSRSEFSIPKHVLRIIGEVLSDDTRQTDGLCRVAPVVVTIYPLSRPSRTRCKRLLSMATTG